MNISKLLACGIVCVVATLVTMTTSSPSDDFYELLGVGRRASTKEIRRAYRRMAAQYHPDMNKDDPNASDTFVRLAKANEVLSDPEKRALYDRFGENGLDGNYQPPPPPEYNPNFFRFNFGDMFHEEPRQEEFGDFFDDFEARERDHQRFHDFAFGGDDDFSGGGHRHRQRSNGGGRRCHTITRKVGNMIVTHTECS